MMQKGFFSIRLKLVIAFSILFAITLFVVSLVRTYGLPFMGVTGSYDYERSQTLSTLSTIADLKKERLLLWLDERKDDARVLSRSRFVMGAVAQIRGAMQAAAEQGAAGRSLGDEIRSVAKYQTLLQHLRVVISAYEMYHKIQIADSRTGMVLASTEGVELGSRVGGMRSFREAIESGYGESVEAITVPKDGRVYMVIARSIRGEPEGEGRGSEIAVALLYVDTDEFLKPLLSTESGLGRSGEIMVINREYRSITSVRDPESALGREIRTDLTVPAVRGKEGIVVANDYRGVPVLAAYRHVRVTPDIGWGMVVKRDREEVFGPLQQRVRYTALVGIVAIALCITLSVAIANRITKPLAALSGAAREIERGDLSVRSDVKTADEVGVLAESFNAMLGRLQHWNEELDVEVKNRTRELHEVNETLRREAAERLRVEEALRRSEEQYRKISQEFDALLNAIPDHLTLQSVDLRILWANHAAMEGAGSGLDDIVGRRCHEIWHGSSKPCESCPVLRSLKTGQPESETLADREGRIWDIRTVPITDEKGVVQSVIEVGRDITDHRKLEEQLRQAQKMEAVGQLAGGVAHDFNNILTAIIGYASLMQMKLGADDPLRQGLEQILASSERAASLTHSLLAFSRKQIMNPKPVDLNGIIDKAQKLIARLIGEDIDLSAKLAGEALTIMADSVQIEQVLMNLVTNARDAMPDGGVLTVRTERLAVDDEFARAHPELRPGPYARLTVSDTGIGMDVQTTQRIFEPFFTTKELGKGTGLGLSMVYGIVRQHNGTIAVYSEPDKGTTFRIYLPLVGEQPAVETESTPAASLRGTETALVVEDDDHVRKITRTILEAYGYAVIEARDGDEAVQLFEENRERIDLTILDVVLPKRNGREIYEAMKKTSPHVKALFMSGYTANIVHKKGVLDEGLKFISKPVAPRELLKMVRKVLDEG